MPTRARLRGVATQMLLWAGPLSVGGAILLLLANARYFGHGPRVPTAGDERAWDAMWGALALVGLGFSVGSIAGLAWLALAVRGRRRVSPLEWFRTAANVVIGAALAFVWIAEG
jgi:Na+/H+ antiporter NhaD/arsenite permease-like protein